MLAPYTDVIVFRPDGQLMYEISMNEIKAFQLECYANKMQQALH